jgi:WD40 repeat protein
MLRVLDESQGATAAAFSGDGNTLFTASANGIVRIWDVAADDQRHQARGHIDEVKSVSFSPDGTAVLSASNDGTVRLWDRTTGKQIRIVAGDTINNFMNGTYFTYARFSPDGAFVVACNMSKPVLVWRAKTDRALFMPGHMCYDSAAVSEDSKSVITVYGGLVELWDPFTGKQQRTFRVAEDIDMHHFDAASQDGTLLAASGEGTIEIWDVKSGELLRTVAFDGGMMPQMAFSGENHLLAAMSLSGGLYLWDLETGARKNHLGLKYGANSIKFSPDAKMILSLEYDGSLHFWDAATLREVNRIEGVGGGFKAADYSPDGKTVVTAAADKVIRWMPADVETLLQLAGSRIQRPVQALTRGEEDSSGVAGP